MSSRASSIAAGAYHQFMAQVDPRQFVSRAGVKLEHALGEFQIDVADWICVDFGCNVGGFTEIAFSVSERLTGMFLQLILATTSLHTSCERISA